MEINIYDTDSKYDIIYTDPALNIKKVRNPKKHMK